MDTWGEKAKSDSPLMENKENEGVFVEEERLGKSECVRGKNPYALRVPPRANLVKYIWEGWSN